MRASTLGRLLIDLRAETRRSTNPAHNAATRDNDVALLQRIQETLWEDYDWPHLRVERLVRAQAGARFIAPPDGVRIDRIQSIKFFYGGEWVPLHAGIEDRHYNDFNSYAGDRSWPVERWQIYEGENLEVWPVPSENGTDPAVVGQNVVGGATIGDFEGWYKITGIRNLRPLVADSDTADLDDRLLVLQAASELLAASGADDAGVKEAKANRRLLKLRGNLSPVKRFKLYGTSQPQGRDLRGPPRVHYRVTTG